MSSSKVSTKKYELNVDPWCKSIVIGKLTCDASFCHTSYNFVIHILNQINILQRNSIFCLMDSSNSIWGMYALIMLIVSSLKTSFINKILSPILLISTTFSFKTFIWLSLPYFYFYLFLTTIIYIMYAQYL